MPGDASFLVEDFVNSITSQLDRVQDALRFKAVNRPLTYALKELSLELKVFVEADAQGNVRFRNSGPNETGSSTVHLSFTTITKPMIEENTISLSTARSTPLNELGLSQEETQRLEQVGVRNLAQLQRLGSSTGVSTVSRIAAVSADRLRQALATGQPKITTVKPAPKPTPRPAPPIVKPAPPTKPPVKPAPSIPSPIPATPRPGPFIPPVVRPTTPTPRPGGIAVTPGTRRLNLMGANLMSADGDVQVRLNDQPLRIAEADDDRLVVELPAEAQSGALEVSLPGGETLSFPLSIEDGESDLDESASFASGDPWSPEDEER